MGNALHHADQAARLGDVHAVRRQLDRHARLHALALVHRNVENAGELVAVLRQAHGADRASRLQQLALGRHDLVHHAVIIGINIFPRRLLMALRVVLIDASLHVPVVYRKFRAVLRHAGVRRLLRLLHVGDQLSFVDMVSGLDVKFGHFPARRMGDVHDARRIEDQSLAVGFFREGAVEGPKHDGEAEHGDGDQSHPAHGAGDADHGVEFFRGAQLVQGGAVEDLVVGHFAAPPSVAPASDSSNMISAWTPSARPSMPLVTTISPSVSPDRTSI